MELDMEFFAGVVIGLIAGLLFAGKIVQGERRNAALARRQKAIIRERLQASFHVPDDNGAALAAAIRDEQERETGRPRLVVSN